MPSIAELIAKHCDADAAAEVSRAAQDLNAPVDEEGRTLLHIAVAGRAPRTVAALLEAGVNVNVRDRQGSTALVESCRAGEAGLAGAILQARDDVDFVGNGLGETALHWACQVLRLFAKMQP
ncbi:hypothetical protein T484DRAFT_1762205 [Baffinella frigidus]|nr:hypothetical protein T484DRAFT_1762205 [Cryptophyta sp. CCMP2293]